MQTGKQEAHQRWSALHDCCEMLKQSNGLFQHASSKMYLRHLMSQMMPQIPAENECGYQDHCCPCMVQQLEQTKGFISTSAITSVVGQYMSLTSP
jgi:hypothetical protein